jgi:drug/metabolite transporter (DMT)-like permease
MATSPRPARWKILLSFAIIYLVWGSTFLAIRVAVHETPPFLIAAMRFFAAGLILFAWTRIRGERMPSARQWASASLLGLLIFVFDYGLLFWAEQRVPSGLAAVMLATIPAFMAIAEILILRTQRPTFRLGVALLIGLGGVAVLVSPSLNVGGEPVETAGAVALIVAAIGWSIASALTRKLPLPESKMVSAGAQMLTGGVMLAFASAALGEFHRFHPSQVSRGAWLALAYLVVAGSIVGFTAYLWLLHHESPTKVGTYAYVNPAVAVVIGYFFAGEPLGPRTLLGTLLVLVSVVVITTARKPAPTASEARETATAPES